MKVTRHTALFAVALTALALSACAPETPAAAPTKTVTAPEKSPVSADPEPEPTDEEPTASEPESEEGELPDLTATKTLQEAQDAAQAAGFYELAPEVDGTGQGRLPLWDRGWVVCSQEPEPGAYSTGTTVTLTAVKQGESC
ncbi:hypothetical protein QFZ75_008038 [Streptomyces sp. V3I8]|uniref:hypothetical protein n=1 Tax=Streptomyces sp. V3I8 TaxID=3042279 RepID=UPI002789BDF1|nr:hypothetical protein [Streptomyces sp. V3I8]MDQ1041536.1 hypothetical protein [Streptomyces sp. V3I8]